MLRQANYIACFLGSIDISKRGCQGALINRWICSILDKSRFLNFSATFWKGETYLAFFKS